MNILYFIVNFNEHLKKTLKYFYLKRIFFFSFLVNFVGKKDVIIYFEKIKEDFILKGKYFSEGRNILGNKNIIINKDSTDNTFQKQINIFSDNIKETIEQSYARKLKTKP